MIIEKLTIQLDQQTAVISKQSEKIEELLSEIRQLKKLSKKPKIRPSNLPKDPDDKNNIPPTSPNGKTTRPGSSKRNKNAELKINKEERIQVKDVPKGARFKGYQTYVVQDLIIKPEVTKYLLERWQLPDGNFVIAQLPKELSGYHFGPTLRAYVLHQHHHQCVTQPLLHKQLLEWGVDISSGQLNRLLIEDKEEFHTEKTEILSAGLSVSSYIQVDDTGARHQGKTGYCTFIGNDLFS